MLSGRSSFHSLSCSCFRVQQIPDEYSPSGPQMDIAQLTFYLCMHQFIHESEFRLLRADDNNQ